MIPDKDANEKQITRPVNSSVTSEAKQTPSSERAETQAGQQDVTHQVLGNAAELDLWTEFLNFPEDDERETANDSGNPTFTQLRARLSASVTGHRDVIDQLALAFDPRWVKPITTHPNNATTSQMQVPSVRERILIIGSSGSGKSHLMQALAQSLGVPCVIIDASAISESGWQGMQPTDVLTQLYNAVGQDRGALERGPLLLLDEFDKICPTSPYDYVGASVRRGRQQSLLSLLGGVTPVRFSVEDELRRVTWMEARTDQIPIIAAGAFPGLAIHGRTPTDAELIAYGMLPELASRLSTRFVLSSRTPVELADMWRAPGGVVDQLASATRRIGYDLRVTDGAVALAAHIVTANEETMTPRGGAALLSAAVRTAVIRALLSDRPTADPLVIAPDDLSIVEAYSPHAK